MGEVKRVFHKKMWILIAVAVLGNLCLFLYSELAGRSFTEMFFAAGQYQKLVERYENMSLEQAQERLGTEFSNIRKYAKILKQENSPEETKEPVQNEIQNSQTAENAVQKQTSEELLSEVDEGSREMIAYHQSLTAQQQTQLELQLKQLRSKLEYLNGYETSIDTVMANAENMKRFRIFSKQNTFSYSNILRTAQDFERVQNVELKLDNDKGADAFVHYNLMYYIAAALMVAVIYSLFDERENGMWQIVHNTPNGRTVLALKRLLLLAGGSFAILFLLYGTTFLTAMLLYGGVKDLTNPVQTFVDFGKFTYTLSKSAYILRLFFLSWFLLHFRLYGCAQVFPFRLHIESDTDNRYSSISYRSDTMPNRSASYHKDTHYRYYHYAYIPVLHRLEPLPVSFHQKMQFLKFRLLSE